MAVPISWTNDFVKEQSIPNIEGPPYTNYYERNVHVWATDFETKTPRLTIWAGCWIDNSSLTASRFYEWLNIIASPTPGYEFYLAKLRPFPDGQCPTVQDIKDLFMFAEHPAVEVTNTSQPLLPGHYCIYESRERDGKRCIYHANPGHKKTYIQSRVPTPHLGTGPSSRGNRPSNSMEKIRDRDQHCRVTGRKALFRHRGDNFTGLEAAHIYPRAHISTMHLNCSLPSRIILENPVNVDGPLNMLLLRSDVHDAWDDYQFGFMKTRVNGYLVQKLFRFERTGAVFNPHAGGVLLPPLGPRALIEPEPADPLLADHFKICLLWHVAGGGRPPK